MMDPQAELLALRRLYMLLVKDEQCLEDTGFENLKKNARRLLLNLLDSAANKAFEAHAKMIGTQFRPSYSLWSTQEDQSRDELKLQPFFSLGNSPTGFERVGQSTTKVPNMQPFDLLTGEGIFGESKNQEVSSGQSTSISPGDFNVRLKRCRVCLKPKVKQFTKEFSFRDGGTFSNRSQTQNRKRSWENENDPSDGEDPISRAASAKILQIESCISSLQEASKRVNFFDSDSESGLSQTGIFALGRRDLESSTTSPQPWKPRDMGRQWHDQSGSINELTLQSQPFKTSSVNMMLPRSQTTSQPAEYVSQRTQHDHMPAETYNHFHGTGFTSNLNKAANNHHPSLRNESSQISNEWLNEMQMTQLWIPPVESTVHSRHHSEVQESEITRREHPVKTYKDKDQLDYHRGIRGKHELVDPKRLVSSKSRSLSDSPVSSSNYSSSWKTQSQSQSQSQQDSISLSDSESVHSGSSISTDHEETESGSESESEMYSVSSEDQRPYMNSSDESSGSISGNTLPKKDGKMGNKKLLKTKSESEMNSVSSQDESSYVSSSSASSGTMSKKPVSTKGHKGGNKKEVQRKNETEIKSVPTRDHSSSGLFSKKTIPKKGHKMGDLKKLKKEQLGRFKKLKDKLSIIFHQHHHHHHHHHHDGGAEKEKHKEGDKKSIWKHAKKAISHRKKKDEAFGEQAVNKIEKKALVLKVGDKNKKGDKHKKSQLKDLVGGFLKHSTKQSKKSNKSKSIVKKTPSRASKQDGGGKMGKKMQWLQMLRQQRKIKRIDKLRGKVKIGSKVSKTKKK